MKNIRISAILLLLWASNASADVVTQCESPEGYSYYPADESLPKTGWIKDGISKGSYLVTRDTDGKYDIIYTDSTRTTISSREDGGKVTVISKSNDHLVLLVAYPEMNVETWYFRLNGRGVGEVTVSQARYGKGAIFNKHGLMRAACSK